MLSFADGNVDNPAVVASYYNGQHSHPFDISNQSGFKTRTIGSEDMNNGHQLCFDDRASKPRFYIKSQGNKNLRVKGNSEKHIGADSSTQVNQGTVSMQVGKTLRIIAGKKVVFHVGSSQLVLDKAGVHFLAHNIKVKQRS